MSSGTFDTAPPVSKIWTALKRLDKNDNRVVALREVLIPPGSDLAAVIQIFTSTFRLNSPDLILKIRNHRGFLIPLNGSVPVNSKHKPYVLEVTSIFQHVTVKARTIPMTVINKSMKTRLHIIDRRIQRLEELLPQIKQRHNEKLTQVLAGPLLIYCYIILIILKLYWSYLGDRMSHSKVEFSSQENAG
ncbi:uncharacterized protein si:zfos-1056e6.1 isoform X1 [Periophthalmus magnuspinnatus]|uniref:uncharacterized protein si:zfos-1056e6.1 isoform X1 n=1 Tax=Periophthalmus magnuspinnatus TaxID=409849 RepID=UPI0024370CA5|nr:uncharacterized protein si:zfos-1056e6.1 isoform X1 [Periophthalmus magnuspinnatus]